jgi:hypothetical protein
MQKTFATEEGKQYKVVFTINTIGWPSFRVQDSISGDDIVSTGMQLPGTYSYTFVARGSRTTIFFEEVEAVNSTLVLSSLIFSEEGKSSRYRYGFSGQQRDDDVSGGGNTYTAEYWEYDSRLGRRCNIDVITKPWESSYVTFHDNPIALIDPRGLDPIYPTPDGKAPKSDVPSVPLILAPAPDAPDPNQGSLRFGIELKDIVIVPDNTSVAPLPRGSNSQNEKKGWFATMWDKFTAWIKSGANEKTEMPSGIVGYQEGVKRTPNESRVSNKPSNYVDYGPMLGALNSVKNSAAIHSIYGAKTVLEASVTAIGDLNETVGHGKEIISAADEIKNSSVKTSNNAHGKLIFVINHPWTNGHSGPPEYMVIGGKDTFRTNKETYELLFEQEK